MKTDSTTHVVMVFLTVVALVPTRASAQSQADGIEAFGRACAPSLVPRELLSSSNQDVDTAFRKVACESYFRDDATTAEGGGGITFFEVVSLDGNGRSTTKRVEKRAYCADHGMRVSEHTATTTFQRYASAEQLTEWGKCMDLYRAKLPQLVPWSLSSVSASTVTWTLHRDGNVDPSGGAPTIVRLEPFGVKCALVTKGKKITPTEDSLTCTWLADARTATVTLFHSRGSVVMYAARPVEGPEATVVLNLRTTETGTVATHEACGSVVRSLELHEARCIQNGINLASLVPGGTCPGDGKFLYMNVCAEVSAPKPDETLSEPTLRCAQDNERSCDWNGVGQPARGVTWAVNTPTYVKGCQPLSSHSIGIQACAKVSVKGPIEKALSRVRVWPMRSGDPLEFSIPNNAAGELVVTQGGNLEAITVGEEGRSLKLLRAQPDAQVLPFFQYRYVGFGTNASDPAGKK